MDQPPLEQTPSPGADDRIPAFSKTLLGFLIEVVRVVLISVAIIVPVRYFLVQPFYVKGASMEPTFHDNEYLIIDELSYRLRAPERGEVVVVKNPRGKGDYYIKRIIGLPGDHVVIRDGRIRLTDAEHQTGFILDESAYLPPTVRTGGDSDAQLGVNEFFLLGDNRAASLDSRNFGPIQRREIVGRTWVRAWPLSKLDVFRAPTFQNASP